MGFFDGITNFFDSVGAEIKKGADKVGTFFQDKIGPGLTEAGNQVGSFFKNDALPFFSNLGSELKGTLGGLAGGVKDIITNGQNLVGDTIKGGQDLIKTGITTTGDTISNLGNSLTMPLLLIGGGIVLVMLAGKK